MRPLGAVRVQEEVYEEQPGPGPAGPEPDVSIIVPCLDEVDNLQGLLQRLRHAFPAAGRTRAEFVIVDDGSGDGTATLLHSMIQTEPRLVPVVRPRTGGQTAALADGFRAARGRWIAHLDGDLQNDPADLPGMLLLAESGYDAVFGFRAKRNDSLSRRLSSRVAGTIRRLWLHDHIRDIGCSTRVVRRGALARIPQARDLHRYLPALLERSGCRILQVPVHHGPRHRGRSKYTNLGRAVRGVVDLPRMARLAHRLEHQEGR